MSAFRSSKSRFCPGCDWEFPSTFTKTACRFCKTRFLTQRCKICHDFKPTDEFYEYKSGASKGYLNLTCRQCNGNRAKAYDAANPDRKRIRQVRFISKRQEAAEKMLGQWLKASDLPFKPLTEVQWFEACNYFGGCAICGNEHIETRDFFVGFQEGGRYAAWNMLPLCSSCNPSSRRIKNPFKWLDKYVGTAHHKGLTEERKQLIIDYLILQIEKAGGSFVPEADQGSIN